MTLTSCTLFAALSIQSKPCVSPHIPQLQVGISPETDEQADFVREFQRALEDGTINRAAPTLSV